MGRLVIDGEKVYELDEECLKEKYREEKKKNAPMQRREEQREKKNIHR